MPQLSFSLGDLFEQTFGYKTKAFDPDFKPVPGKNSLNPNVPQRVEQGAHGSPYYANDALGLEYFLPVTLTYADDTTVSQQDASLIGSNSLGILNKWNLPYPVISITSKKTIIETQLTERRGTVKELINIQDYEIIIKGFIIGANDEFPEKDVTTLRTIYEQNAALSIQCPLTDIFLLRPDRSGSDRVVITELRFPAIPGVKHVRPYELHLLSDEPFNLLSINS